MQYFKMCSWANSGTTPHVFYEPLGWKLHDYIYVFFIHNTHWGFVTWGFYCKNKHFFRITNSSVKQQANNDKKLMWKIYFKILFIFKLSFSISLLFILILLGYLFYRSYSSLSIAENKESLQKQQSSKFYKFKFI